MARPVIRTSDDGSGVRSRVDFADSVELLRFDLRENPERWESLTLDSYLEALAAIVRACEAWPVNGVRNDVETPSWTLFADLLDGAAIYE